MIKISSPQTKSKKSKTKIKRILLVDDEPDVAVSIEAV